MDWLDAILGILVVVLAGLNIYLGFFRGSPKVIVKARLTLLFDKAKSPPQELIALTIINNRDRKFSISSEVDPIIRTG